MEELSKQIEALSQSVKAMQKDLQDIKILLQGRAQAPTAQPPQNVLLDLGGRPARGENTAKLTMVEFSDYQ
jgi:protein-disulfide isomerase